MAGPRPRPGHRRADDSLPFTSRARPLPAELAGRAWVRWFRPAGIGLAVLAAAALPFLPGLDAQNQAFAYTQVIAYSLVGLSLLVVTGWSGQFSLGQFAFVGIGAYAASRLAAEGFSLPFNLVVGAGLGAAVAAVVGLPALKIRGLFLGVSTLAFAVLAPGWLFNQRFVTGSSVSAVSVAKPRIPGLGEVESLRALYLIGLLVLVLVATALRAVRASGAGRRFIAVRDNPRAAAAHGLPPAGVNLAGFALSGALAALGGVLWGYANANFDATAFHPSFSLAVLAMVVIGGLGTQAGAVIGAVLVFGLPLLLNMKSETIFLLSGALLLLTLLVIPRGLVVVLEHVPRRDRPGARPGPRRTGSGGDHRRGPGYRDPRHTYRDRSLPVRHRARCDGAGVHRRHRVVRRTAGPRPRVAAGRGLRDRGAHRRQRRRQDDADGVHLRLRPSLGVARSGSTARDLAGLASRVPAVGRGRAQASRTPASTPASPSFETVMVAAEHD